MIIFDNYTNENKTEHNSNWPYIPDHPYRVLVVGGSGSGKINALLNLINNEPNIDKIYLYAKDPKYQYLINKREKVGLDYFNELKAFMDYLTNMQDIYKNIEEDNPGKKRKVLIIFDDMIADMISNKKLRPIVTEFLLEVFLLPLLHNLILRCQKTRLNSTHFFVIKIPNKRELQQIALNHSSDIDFKDFIKICKKCTPETYYFLVNDKSLPSDSPLRYRKNILN